MSGEVSGVNEAQREGKEWLERVVRFGFVAKGIVYVTIGILALQTALGSGGQTTGSQGALAAIASEPFGQVLLALVGIGLIGLTLWYIIRAIYDVDREGEDASGLLKRVVFLGSGLIYGLLAVAAFQILLGSGGGGGNTTSSMTGQIMQQSWGRWLIGLIGVGVIAGGIYQFYRAYKAKFQEKMKGSQMSREEIKWGTRAGQVGIAARGVVIVIIGVLFTQAAIQYDPQEAGGVGQALQEIAQQPYGPWLLGLVALGLIAYGLFEGIILSRYRRIQF